MNKHCPAFTEMLLFYPGIMVKFFIFLPLIIMLIIFFHFSLVKIPDESNIHNITSHIIFEGNGEYGFTYNTDSIWKLERYYILDRNEKLIEIDIVNVSQIKSGEYEIRFLTINSTDLANGTLKQRDIQIISSQTFLKKIFTFFTD